MNLDAGTIAVLGKGRTSKEPLTLPEHAKEVLADWLKVRGSAFGPLFINLDRAGKGKDNRLTTKSIWKVIIDLGKKSGVKVRPHGLRHAAITDALDLTDGNVRAVARFSRHKNLQVLTVYDDNRQDLGGAVARLVSEKALLNGDDS